MNTLNLLNIEELPTSFNYPREFLHILNLGISDLEPWYFLHGDQLKESYNGLKTRYEGRTLVPFARRQDNDDVACWEAPNSENIVIIHDFASAGWEKRGNFSTFYDWFRQAIEDLIEFDS